MPKRVPTRPPDAERAEKPAPGVEDAASEYIDKADAYRRYVQEGLDAVARGDVRDWEEVEAELRATFGDFDD
jgi:hypothetical protein